MLIICRPAQKEKFWAAAIDRPIDNFTVKMGKVFKLQSQGFRKFITKLSESECYCFPQNFRVCRKSDGKLQHFRGSRRTILQLSRDQNPKKFGHPKALIRSPLKTFANRLRAGLDLPNYASLNLIQNCTGHDDSRHEVSWGFFALCSLFWAVGISNKNFVSIAFMSQGRLKEAFEHTNKHLTNDLWRSRNAAANLKCVSGSQTH